MIVLDVKIDNLEELKALLSIRRRRNGNDDSILDGDINVW